MRPLFLPFSFLAIEFGILPFKPEDVIESIQTVKKAWLSDDSNISEEIRGLKNLQGFIGANRLSRFVRADISELDSTKISIVGYLDNKNQLFLFHEEGFREACGNVSFKKVLGELDKLGLLYKNNNNRKKGRFKVSNVKERLNLYAVKYRFLEHDFG